MNDEVNVRPFAYAMSLIDGKWKCTYYFGYGKNKYYDIVS